MNQESSAFRIISLNEYRKKHDTGEQRVTVSEVEEGLTVEAYSTNSLLKEHDLAISFTAYVNYSEPLEDAIINLKRAQFKVFSGSSLTFNKADSHYALISPESGIEGVVEPAHWSLTDARPLRPLAQVAIAQGFFSHWVDDDISKVDATTVTTKGKAELLRSMLQQKASHRKHPLFPKSGE